MEDLAEAKVKFGFNLCLNGPLCGTIYRSGPVPFWERYSINFGQEKTNIKGQRFTNGKMRNWMF